MVVKLHWLEKLQMNKLLLIAALLISFFCEAKAQSEVIANITNLRSNDGVCRACLFNNAASFIECGKPYNCISVSVKMKSALAVFSNVQPGSYAIFVFHDINNNNKMDKNFLGVPKEGYGASNNRLPLAAAPHFEDNKFIVSDNNTVSLNIHLRNVF